MCVCACVPVRACVCLYVCVCVCVCVCLLVALTAASAAASSTLTQPPGISTQNINTARFGTIIYRFTSQPILHSLLLLLLWNSPLLSKQLHGLQFLPSLPIAVGPASQDQHLLAVPWTLKILHSVCASTRAEWWTERFQLGRKVIFHKRLFNVFFMHIRTLGTP